MEADCLSSRSKQSDDLPIQGMESVVATVSGYHGKERFNLIKLISYAGSSYVGEMSKSTTHLVCWKFEGEKYNLAKKFKTIIVNHRWVEDCIKERKRLPERPYMYQCGQEIGPLLLEVPLFNKNSGSSNLGNNSINEETAEKYEVFEPVGWTDSFLISKSLLPVFETRQGSADKSKSNPFRRPPKWKQMSCVRNCFQDRPLSELTRVEYEESSSGSYTHYVRGKRKISTYEETDPHSSLRSVRKKTNISEVVGSSSVKPSRIGRRLVKKNIVGDGLESMLSHTYQDDPAKIGTAETLDDGFLKNEGMKEGSENIEEIEESDFRAALQRASNGGLKITEGMEHVNRVPTSELSCVICHTESSSIRGVLPCGHRFCYSCIRNWADHMTSKGKSPTCPLCKGSFASIIKVEDTATSDQKIYSQTIPCASSSMDIFILPDGHGASIQPSLLEACSKCREREPVELLIRCYACQRRCIHNYCQDPPMPQWTCIHCKNLQVVYSRSNF